MKKNNFEKKFQSRQFRVMQPLEIRKNERDDKQSYIVEGYALKYEPYPLYEEDGKTIYEKFKRTAFDDADLSDVIFLYDHQGKVFARTSNGTLKLKFDEVGLLVTADLATSQASRDMYQEIQSGLVTKMSWAFQYGDYSYDEKTSTIVHNSVKKVYDVSAVGIPANNDTVINARKFADGVIGEFEAERLKVQERKRRLLLNIKIAKELK